MGPMLILVWTRNQVIISKIISETVTENSYILIFCLCFISKTGSGIVSKNKYYYGFFNAAMKLPAGFTSGIVIAFYVSLIS